MTEKRRRKTDQPQLRRRRSAAVVGAIAAAAGVVVIVVLVVLVLGSLRDRSDDIARLSVRTAQTAREIQRSRRDNILTACRETNRRHDHTVAVFDRLLDEAAKGASPQRRAQLAQSRTSTLLLIDALAPKRACAARVDRLTDTP